ncbi:alanine--tRNA ligase [Candidatus Dojkabacteria bacterium]|nr:alanine--tRNA ligase [Candidatus Dojkabacteria bacterium]
MLTSKQIRDKYMKFWLDREHAVLPDVSLVPQNDPTLLFVNSGMFQLANYLGGKSHPLGKRLVNIQRCLRTKYDEMLEVGDNRHTLMFEMMGNWSLGDYFKEDQIPWMLKLHVEEYGLDPHKIYVSVWGGDDEIPRDDEAIELWKKAFKEYGIDAEFSEDLENIPKDVEAGKSHKARIFPYGKSDNWWQRAEAPGELGGTSSEIFYDTGIIEREQEKYHINDDSGRFLEIGNSVFMQYKLDSDMKWRKIDQQNIDFGGGLERVVMCVQGKSDIFETDIYKPLLDKIKDISGKEYKNEDGTENKRTRAFRILADHSRAATFILADSVMPSNKDQGYILRRFIRRLVRYGNSLELEGNFTRQLAETIVDHMSDIYPHLKANQDFIYNEIDKEEIKFRRTLERGLKEFEKIRGRGEKIDGEKAFWFYETYGFPFEMVVEELGASEAEVEQLEKDFNTARKVHQEKSRAGAEKKFTGGLADHSEETTRLHTAHHLLLAALKQVLGNHVKQRGSNITNARLRIDFSHNEKLTDEEREEVESIVNEKISEGWIVEKKNMPKQKAKEIGAEMEFGQKYGDMVSVYFIKNPETGEVFSKEFCGGPHVDNTNELARSGPNDKDGKFKIRKEKSSGAGVRRIKAVLE